MSAEKKDALAAHVRKFLDDNRVTCAETIYQVDHVIENAYAFIEGCADIAGYAEYSEDAS